MPSLPTTRRSFLQSLAAGATVPLAGTSGLTSMANAQEKPRALNERLGVGAIGLRYQGSVITHKAQLYGDCLLYTSPSPRD